MLARKGIAKHVWIVVGLVLITSFALWAARSYATPQTPVKEVFFPLPSALTAPEVSQPLVAIAENSPFPGEYDFVRLRLFSPDPAYHLDTSPIGRSMPQLGTVSDLKWNDYGDKLAITTSSHVAVYHPRAQRNKDGSIPMATMPAQWVLPHGGSSGAKIAWSRDDILVTVSKYENETTITGWRSRNGAIFGEHRFNDEREIVQFAMNGENRILLLSRHTNGTTTFSDFDLKTKKETVIKIRSEVQFLAKGLMLPTGIPVEFAASPDQKYALVLTGNGFLFTYNLQTAKPTQCEPFVYEKGEPVRMALSNTEAAFILRGNVYRFEINSWKKKEEKKLPITQEIEALRYHRGELYALHRMGSVKL